MKCLDTSQLNRLAAGEMPEQEARFAHKHVSECERCRERLTAVPSVSVGLRSLADAILQIDDCPAYDVLSDYVDNTLADVATLAVAAHANRWEACWADIAHIRELRAHAEFRDPVLVAPRSTRRAGSTTWTWRWQWSAVLGAACVAALALVLVRSGVTPPDGPSTPLVGPPPGRQVAVGNKPGTKPAVANANKYSHPIHQDTAMAPAKKPGTGIRRIPSRVAVRPILVDGKYGVILSKGRRTLALGSKPALRSVDKRIAAAVQSKLRTGHVKSLEPFDVAMTRIYIRDGGEYQPPSVAPKLVAPVDTVILSARPLLKWKPVDLTHSYRVTVTDEEGRAVYDAVTTHARAKPSSPLARGKDYAWRVGVRFAEEDEWANSAPRKFRVLSDDGLKLIDETKRQLPGSRIALGAVYESLGLSDEARRQYTDIARRNPHSSLAREMTHGK